MADDDSAPLEPQGDSGASDRVRFATNAAPQGTFDHEKIRHGVRLLLEGIGLDPQEPAVEGTPDRVARMYDEVFAGLLVDSGEVLEVMFEEGHDELILQRDIPLASVCEHHLIPFIGRAHVGYIPNERGAITGLSKLARLVDVTAKRPNVQERITTQIADTMVERLAPRGVIVVIEAEHLCLTMRGVRKPGSMTVTSAVRGIMREDPRSRAEAMALATGRSHAPG
jgi:GTP cyclohydrolase I